MSSSKAMTPPTAMPAIAAVDNEEEARLEPVESGEFVAALLLVLVAPLEVVVVLLIVVEVENPRRFITDRRDRLLQWLDETSLIFDALSQRERCDAVVARIARVRRARQDLWTAASRQVRSRQCRGAFLSGYSPE